MEASIQSGCAKLMRVLAAFHALAFTFDALAAPQDFIGTWQVELMSTPGALFLMEVEEGGAGISIFADGSPVSGTISGNAISFQLDVYDGGDALRLDEFSGELVDGRIIGHYIAEDTGVPGVKGSPVAWEAVPYVPYASPATSAPDPGSLAGFWSVATRGIKKAVTSYTMEGQAVLDRYKDMDDPINRCVNPGLLRTLRVRSGSAVDIFHQDGVLKMDFPQDIGNAQRYVFLDGRDFPQAIAPTPMGYSIGHWEGNVLVIETRGFTEMFYNSNGAPVSSEATLKERLWLTPDGSLVREYSFHDPRYYTRPLTNSGTLVRRDTVVPESYECDPHAFYRILDVSGDLPEYFERAADWRR